MRLMPHEDSHYNRMMANQVEKERRLDKAREMARNLLSRSSSYQEEKRLGIEKLRRSHQADWLSRFTKWKQDVSSHLVGEAGYNLEHAEEMLGSIDLSGMYGTSMNEDTLSAEDAAHDIIWMVEGK